MRRSLALLALLALLGTFGPIVLLSHSTVDEHSPSSNGQVVNVIVAGATGDLAAKYLWVALFRLALEAASTSGRTYRFFAGASDSLERGYAWRERFFGEGFAQRVCGAEKGDGQQLSAAQMKCRAFLETEFKPSVTYAPLRTESHYRDLGRRLEHMNEQLPTGISEEGRMVYLAIPPQFFLESCELIHEYLRPQRLESGSPSFLRVVVEKPFGRDLQSAHELATHLRAIYSSDELYVMDHYSGKLVVHALRKYFQLNAAVLHPYWNSKCIEEIHIEMTEKATLQHRVHYFDSAGIIRDIMVNHLQLLLSVAVAPSFDPAIYTAPLSPTEFTRRQHEAQLRFIEALKIPRHDSRLLLLAQYDEYATHYRNEMGHSLNQSDHYTPTAAMIELSCTLDDWRNTTFRLAAAKASDARLLAVTITFKGGVFTGSQNQPCTFTVIIQQAPNADTRRSHRIEWSCDITKELTSLRIPESWEYLEPFDHHVITPTQPNLVRKEAGYEVRPWELGDEPSAYDVLLQEVSIGSSSHFADLDEVEAAWALWTPVIQATETSTTIDAENQLRQDTTLQHISYPAGTSPWKQTPPLDEPFLAKEEL